MILEIADITEAKAHLYPLLDEAYDRIFLPAFPDPDEQEELDQIKDALAEKVPGVRITVNIVGRNLGGKPDERVVMGIGIAYYYRKENAGLLAYNAVEPRYRGRGLGKLLVRSRIRTLKEMAAENGKKRLGGVFIECNDPDKVPPDEDSLDPALRLRIFKKWGAREVPVRYAQPPLNEDKKYFDKLRLLNYPVDGRYAGPGDVRAFIRGIYTECHRSQPDRLKEDPYYQRAIRDIARWKPDALSLRSKKPDGYKAAENTAVSWL